MNELAVTDSHALIWAVQRKSRKLGRAAERMFARADEGRGAIYVPTIVLVEVAHASHMGSLDLKMGFAAWTRALFSSPRYLPADLTVPIILRAEALYAIPERSDRLIAATALELDVPLITRDPEIRRIAGVETIW